MPTTHAEPTYEVDGIIHYCVANMPGAVPVTSAHALNNATLLLRPAARRPRPEGAGRRPASAQRPQRPRGKVTNRAVAEALGYDMTEAKAVLAA